MTKFILHGGRIREDNLNNQQFFKEIVEATDEPVKLLLVNFARQKENQHPVFLRDKRRFIKENPGKNIIFSLASPNSKILATQLKETDSIYVTGGRHYHQVKKTISKVRNLKKLLENKTIAGSSAGAYLLAKYSYYTGLGGIIEGLGLVPVKVVGHYSQEKKKFRQILKEYKQDLKIHPLKEGEFIIIKS